MSTTTVENTNTQNTQSTMDTARKSPKIIYLRSKKAEAKLFKDLNSKNIYLQNITRHLTNKTKKEMKQKFDFKGLTHYYVLECDANNPTPSQNKLLTYKDNGLFTDRRWEGAKEIMFAGRKMYVTQHPYGDVYIVNLAK
jgi:hypothetical protein